MACRRAFCASAFEHSFDTSSGQNALAEKRPTPLWRCQRRSEAHYEAVGLAEETVEPGKSAMKRLGKILVKRTTLSRDLRLHVEETARFCCASAVAVPEKNVAPARNYWLHPCQPDVEYAHR